MTDVVFADASPEKRLFISLLTRDIPMVAAFLDLIDNSVNAAIEPVADRLDTAAGYVNMVGNTAIERMVDIHLSISRNRVEIADTASGISLDTAQRHVFKFGRSQEDEDVADRLSVYGLGLKRAFFKLGRRVKITSDHVDGGFDLNLDVQKWARDPKVPWQFELAPREGANAGFCGTRVAVWRLHPETQTRLDDGLFEAQLREVISKTYAYFLANFVRIYVNGEQVTRTELRVGRNNASDGFEEGNVTCAITAGLGTPEGDRYRDSGSGWFVFCNGRTVISADKTPLTGWQNNGLPIFQPKHRPFLGTVYFVSKHADRLPWDTTKSGINEDSEIWQRAKRLMVAVGRQVTSFLDKRYADEGTEVAQKDLKDAGHERVEAMVASVGKKGTFSVPRAAKKVNIRIQYDAKIDYVQRISEYLSKPEMSGSDVGRHTFDFFLRNEVGEE